MRDGTGAIVAKADVLRKAEEAIRGVGTNGNVLAMREEMLLGSTEEAIAKISICSWLGFKEKLGMRCPGQPHEITLDFAAKIGGVECWFDVVMLEGELVLLEDNDRSTMLQDALFEYRGAMAREIVARVSRRIGRLTGWDKQTVALVCDPMRSIARFGGLEEALEELGERCAWLSAVAMVGDERLEIHDVPGSTNPLDGRVRDGILRLHDRRLLSPSADGAGPQRG